jgi:hypothetical protein
LNDVLDSFVLTTSHSLGIMSDNPSSDYSMTCELQTTIDSSGIEWPAFTNHIPCPVHVKQLALGVFRSSLGEMGWTKYWEAHEGDQQ